MKSSTLFTITLLCIICITSAYQNNNGNGNGNRNGNDNSNDNGNGNRNDKNYDNSNDGNKNKDGWSKDKYDMTTTDFIFNTDTTYTDMFDTDTTDMYDTDTTDDYYDSMDSTGSGWVKTKNNCWRKRKKRKQGNGKWGQNKDDSNDKNDKWGKKRWRKKCKDSDDGSWYWLSSSTWEPYDMSTTDSDEITTETCPNGTMIDPTVYECRCFVDALLDACPSTRCKVIEYNGEQICAGVGSLSIGQAMGDDGIETGSFETNGNIGKTIGIIGGVIGVVVFSIIILGCMYVKRNNKYDNVSVRGNCEDDIDNDKGIEIGRALPTDTWLNGENQIETHTVIKYESSDEDENELINGRNDNYLR